MGTRGFYGFRYKKKYYMIFNSCDSYYSNLGLKLLNDIRYMVKNNQFEKWVELFLNLNVINQNDVDYFHDLNYHKLYKLHFQVNGSFINTLNSGYIFIDECLDKINYHCLDGEFFYILDFDKKRFVVKEIGYRRQKYNLFNGEIDKVYFEDSSGEESDDESG